MQLQQMVAVQLRSPEAEAVEAHVEACASCQQQLDKLTNTRDFQGRQRPASLEPWEESAPKELHPALAGAESGEDFLRQLAKDLPTNMWVFQEPGGRGAAGTSPPTNAIVAATADQPVVVGYDILGKLGRGGMGVVYQARQRDARRVVALKMILAGAQARPDEMARFRTEIEAVARLQHPYIVQIFEVGAQDGRPYFSMEFADGGSLAQQFAGIPWPGRRAAHLLEQLGRAIHYAHERGVLHRDLTPANVLLMADGTPKITDFGLAKILLGEPGLNTPGCQTQSGAILGTPSYMPPEQAAGRSKEIGPAGDVYALGAILYEMLTGRPPFRAETPLETLRQVIAEEPVPPSRLQPHLPRDLVTICLKCLRKESVKRYASASALAEDLRRFQAGEPILARPIRSWERAVKWARRRPATAALLALVVFVATLGFGLVTWQWRRATAVGEELAAQTKELKSKNYARNIALAANELASSNVGRAEELLDECPDGLRGWEWHYLKRLSQAPPVTLPTGERIGLGHAADLAFSPLDGRLLAAPSRGREIKIWDASTGRELRTLSGHADRILRLAFSPDGRLLASGSEDKTVKVWDVTIGHLLCTCPHEGRVHGLTFSPDGRYLASAGGDNRVKIWESRRLGETMTATPLRDFPGYFFQLRLGNVAFSPDGRFLASGSEEDTVRVWDVTTGREVHTLRGHTEPVYSVAFSADARSLASKGWDNRILVWDLATGRMAFPPLGRGDLDSSGAWSMALSPDGRRLAQGGGHRNGEITLYDALTGQTALTLHGHTERITCVVFSPDGKRLASASFDKTVRLWDTETGEELLALRGHKDLVGRVLFDPSGWRLASSSEDGTVRVCDGTPLGKDIDPRVRTLRTDAGIVYGVAFSPDSRWLASGGGQVGKPGEVKVWDTASAQELHALPGHTNRVFSVAFGPEGILATAGADAMVKFWDTRTGQEVRTFPSFRGAVHSVALSPDGRRLATCDTSMTAKLWDLTTGQPVTLRGHGGFVHSAVFSPSGERVATAGVDGTVRLWDATDGKAVFPFRGHTTRVLRAVFSPNSELVASTDTDGKVLIWNAATGSVLYTFPGDGEYVLGLAFSPDGRRLAAASWQEVKIWDLTKTHETPQKLGGLAGTICGVAFSPDGKYLAAAGGYKGKGEIKIWDVTLWENRP
jgi:WD40 repeat protein